MPTEVLTADDGMTQDEKDLKAMAVLREIRADPHRDVEISSWGTTWTVTVEHHFVAQGPDLANAVLEAHAKAQPRAQKRCSGCRHSGHNKGNPNLLCKHTDNVRPVYVNHALGFGESCGPNFSNFEQREDTYLNGDPKENTNDD